MQLFRPMETIVGKTVDAQENHHALPEENAKVDSTIVAEACMLVICYCPRANEVIPEDFQDDE